MLYNIFLYVICNTLYLLLPYPILPAPPFPTANH